MKYKIYSYFISDSEFRKAHPALYYGVDGEWFVVQTRDEQICAMVPYRYRSAYDPLKRFQNHSLFEIKIRLKEELPCLLVGTPFQYQVWTSLLEIPQGKTISYKDLAHRVQRPLAARAVGSAVGANPIVPLIPCHRVVGSSLHIGGYGLGINAKIDFLKQEGVDTSCFKGIFSAP